MNRRSLLAGAAAAFAAAPFAPALAQAQKKGVMFMNRIGPSASELFVANADGTAERKLLQTSGFDYHASFSADGKWIVFTSERDGLGQANLYRARADGTGIERLTNDPAVDDQGALSPDGSRVAFMSTRGPAHTANIWLLDIKTKQLRNLTGAAPIQGDPVKPDGFYRPSFSPDGKWIAFSSDKGTEWRGHDAPNGWEHTQELSIYVIGADGKGFRRVASAPGKSMGSPSWSRDGKRIVFYETTTEETWGARRPERIATVSSQIVSVDAATGARTEHTTGPGFKVAPQYLNANSIAYHIKGGPLEGVYFTSDKTMFKLQLRSPHYSPSGAQMIYEKVSFRPRAEQLPLYSWDKDWDYRSMDVFPVMSKDGKMVFTEKAANSSVVTMNPDGSNRKRIFDTSMSELDPKRVAMGLAGAFQPVWSPDGQWVAFGLGFWFQERATNAAKIMRVRSDGTGLESLTDGTVNAGFPSYSPDGKKIVFRVWGKDALGLRILDLDTRQIQTLTTGIDDNLPAWSPDGSKIAFTRKVDAVNFDVFTIAPDGSNLKRLTTSGANDGHAVWTPDGRLLYNSGMYGFRDEAALYDFNFQPYGQIFVMNADGSGKRMLTDSPWEDSMPLYVPAALMARKS